jgi:hypothetical protein
MTIIFNLFILTALLFNICFHESDAKELCPTFCSTNFDCENCFIGPYCSGFSCSEYCKSAEEGDACTSDTDCNPSCAIQVKLYCVDAKCSIMEKCAFNTCKNNNVDWGWWLFLMILFLCVSIGCKACCSKISKSNSPQYSGLNQNNDWSIPINHSNETGYSQYNAINDPPPPYPGHENINN